MNWIWLNIIWLAILASFGGMVPSTKPPLKDLKEVKNFYRGEVLDYRLDYGFLTVGRGTITIHPELYQINELPCMKTEVKGWTAGALNIFIHVDDTWGAYLDTVELLPQVTYRYVEEGKYHKQEFVKFDHTNQIIKARIKNFRTGKDEGIKTYQAAKGILDVVGGYLRIRTLDFKNYSQGDTITLHTFFEDEFYDFQIIYQGKEVVKTKAGKIRSLKLTPIMPDNKVFEGANSVTAWFSDDENKIPVKVVSDLSVGKIDCILVKYEGIHHKLNLVD